MTDLTEQVRVLREALMAVRIADERALTQGRPILSLELSESVIAALETTDKPA